MRVALLKDVPALGKRGDVKDVHDGYGRNFLIKNKMAEILTPQTVVRLKMEKVREEKSMADLRNKSLALKEKIEKLNMAIKTKVGESGQVFGSVTPADILAELEKNGIKIEKNQILSNPVKTLGKHEIKIKLPQGIEAELQIVIEP